MQRIVTVKSVQIGRGIGHVRLNREETEGVSGMAFLRSALIAAVVMIAGPAWGQESPMPEELAWKLLEIGRASDIDCTIFRPTLIYGAGIDRSLAPIARFVRRWRVLPIPLRARGLRQPVHAQDIARACNAVIDNPATYGKTYALGGGERLTFSAMLRRLRGKQAALLIPLPRFLLRALRTGGGFSSGALSRLNEALIADNEPAMREFGYAPRAFVAEAVLPDAAPEKQ
jgi:uncharacterized protein YbjT (DUF2867 family)